jgi:hypothetical protein
MTTPQEIFRYATGRWLKDPEFHARVSISVQVLEEIYGEQDDGKFTTAAAVGLAAQWVDPQSGRICDD